MWTSAVTGFLPTPAGEVTPVIVSADSSHSVSLRPFEVAGKNAWYYEQRLGACSRGRVAARRQKKVYGYSDAVPYQDWMEHSSVYFNVERVSCCGDRPVVGPQTEPVAMLNFTPPMYQAAFSLRGAGEGGGEAAYPQRPCIRELPRE